MDLNSDPGAWAASGVLGLEAHWSHGKPACMRHPSLGAHRAPPCSIPCMCHGTLADLPTASLRNPKSIGLSAGRYRIWTCMRDHAPGRVPSHVRIVNVAYRGRQCRGLGIPNGSLQMPEWQRLCAPRPSAHRYNRPWICKETGTAHQHFDDRSRRGGEFQNRTPEAAFATSSIDRSNPWLS